MMHIKAVDYIKSGFSQNDADKLIPVIEDAIENLSVDDTVAIDFVNVEYFTTLFFNQTLTWLVDKLGKERYERTVQILNISDSGMETYRHALNYAIEYYSLNNNGRKQYEAAINEAGDGSR